MTALASATNVSRRAWIALAVVCLGQFMVVLDSTIVNVALDDIQADLHFSAAALTWVVNAYLVTFGSFMLVAGRVGDLVGRRRVFLFGVALFTLASAACGFADSQGLLIVARFIQGIGGAVAFSVTIALIVSEFPDAADRAKAMSVYMFVAVGGGSVGLLLGGLIAQSVDWHWIFFINLPIGIATILLGRAHIDEREAIGTEGGVDVAGALLVTVSLMLAVYAIVGTAEHGWGSSHTLGWGGAALALFAAFLALEARIANPILPLGIFRVPRGGAGGRDSDGGHAGARLVCLPELTLSPYLAVDAEPSPEALARAESIPDGPTTDFARRMAADTGAHVHASLYERAGDPERDPRGFNTAICVAPDGTLVARTRKLHIPVTAGYHEDRWFRPGPADGDDGAGPFPVVGLGEARVGFPILGRTAAHRSQEEWR